MRIEINGMGLLGLPASVVGFESDFKSLIKKQENIVSSFVAIKKKACNVNGGIGTLQTAVDNLAARIGIEEQTAQALQTVQNKVGDFIDLAHNVDEKVGEMVRQHQEEFYNANPWARPPEPEAEKSWHEKAKYYYNKGKELVEDVKDKIKDDVEKVNEFAKDLAVKWVKKQVEVADNWIKLQVWQYETLVKIGDSIETWCIDHEQQLKEIAIGAAVIVGEAVLAICLPEIGVPLLGVTLAGMLADTVVDAGLACYDYYNGNEEYGSTSVFDALFRGGSKGFMTGAVSTPITILLSPFITPFAASAVGSATGEWIHSMTDDGEVDESELENIILSAASGFLTANGNADDLEKILWKEFGKETAGNIWGDVKSEFIENGINFVKEKIFNLSTNLQVKQVMKVS